MSHLFQLGETCVSAGRDMCLTFFSLVRHVSRLCDTVSHLFQLGETCVSPFSIPGSNTVNYDDDDEMTPSQSWAKTAAALKLFTH